jgi:hypothetical protein
LKSAGFSPYIQSQFRIPALQLAEILIPGCKKRQGTTSQLAKILIPGCTKRQGTTSQAAEKRILGRTKRQGTTSVVP